MPEEKRTFHSETVLNSSSLRLEPADPGREKLAGSASAPEARKPLFSPELIARLAERIKKL
jgi:hypothetical protein